MYKRCSLEEEMTIRPTFGAYGQSNRSGLQTTASCGLPFGFARGDFIVLVFRLNLWKMGVGDSSPYKYIEWKNNWYVISVSPRWNDVVWNAAG